MTGIDYSRHQTWPTGEEESPFRFALTSAPYARSEQDRLRAFAEDDRFVVRIVTAARIAGRPYILRGSELVLSELVERGIAVPRRLTVIGSRHIDCRPQAFVIAERVRGVPLVDAVADSHQARHVADGVCEILLGFYRDRYECGGAFIGDLKLEQFMWGHVGDDHADHAYLIDLDPGVGTLEPRTTNARLLTSLHWAISHVINMVADLEASAGIQFERARVSADAILATAFERMPRRAEMLREVIANTAPIDGAVFFDDIEV